MIAAVTRWLMAALLCAPLAASAADAAGDAGERERIAGERTEVRAHYVEQERACRERFAVTACVEQARKSQRDALASLRRQEAVLDEATRRQRAAQRMEAIRARISAEEARSREAQPPGPRQSGIRVAPPRAGSASRAAGAASASPAPNAQPHRPAKAASSADSAELAQQRRVAFEARARAAQAHRDVVQQRLEQRQSKGKVSRPLPPEPGASSP